MTIRISSTSFLLPGNRNWAPLAALDTLNFGEYGDWFTSLASNDIDNLLCVLFVDDVIAETPDSEEALNELLTALLLPLELRLKKSQLPTIVAFSGWQSISPISNAKGMSARLNISRRLESLLYEIAARNPALYVLNMELIWARDGISSAFDNRNFYAARCHLSSRGIERLASAAAAVLGRIKNAAKKVLVLDCDNTIWGGVVGEVGLEGIVLGSDGVGNAFSHFQRIAKKLTNEGILLALSSKNNESEVWNVFDCHSGMVLQRDDIVTTRINWEEKAINVRSIAEELDLGLNSFVFWDDNPLEREKMRLFCPEVVTVEVPTDVGEWPSLLSGTDLFARFQVTNEDQKKSAQYRYRAAFISERKKVADEDSFLKTIAMRPKKLAIADATIARAEQLCAKTNQFNLRTARHNAADISMLAKDNPELAFLVELSDRFGDHGIIAMAIAKDWDGIGFLDTFLMSCRVLGRHLEAWMLDQLIGTFKARNAKWMLAEFIPTGRNAVAENFLSSHGFNVLSIENDPSGGVLTHLVSHHGLTGIVYFIDIASFSTPFQDVFS